MTQAVWTAEQKDFFAKAKKAGWTVKKTFNTVTVMKGKTSKATGFTFDAQGMARHSASFGQAVTWEEAAQTFEF